LKSALRLIEENKELHCPQKGRIEGKTKEKPRLLSKGKMEDLSFLSQVRSFRLIHQSMYQTQEIKNNKKIKEEETKLSIQLEGNMNLKPISAKEVENLQQVF